MLEGEKVYEYPPTEKEVWRAMWLQAMVSFRFHTSPKVTVEEYAQQLGTVLAPIKNCVRTEAYSLEELAILVKKSEHQRYRRLYEHEDTHARQMARVLKKMGISENPRFTVYYCPIMADMYQCGRGIGLIEMGGVPITNRQQVIEFEERVAVEMTRSVDNSIGDIYLVGAMLLAGFARWSNAVSEKIGR